MISTGPNIGGTLLPGRYNYKITYVDRNGYESIPSNVSVTQLINPGETAISIAGLPSATGDYVGRRLYRSNGNASGPYDLVANLDRQSSTYLDIGEVLGGTLQRDRADVSNVTLTQVAGGTLPVATYAYRIVMVDAAGREGLASNITTSITTTQTDSVRLNNLPLTLPGYVARRSIAAPTAERSSALLNFLNPPALASPPLPTRAWQHSVTRWVLKALRSSDHAPMHRW